MEYSCGKSEGISSEESHSSRSDGGGDGLKSRSSPTACSSLLVAGVAQHS